MNQEMAIEDRFAIGFTLFIIFVANLIMINSIMKDKYKNEVGEYDRKEIYFYAVVLLIDVGTGFLIYMNR